MTKYFCDRCENEVDKYTGVYEVTIKSPVISWSGDDVKPGTHILCHDCSKELNKFIERKEK